MPPACRASTSRSASSVALGIQQVRKVSEGRMIAYGEQI
jgi:hypothetical protein